MKIQSPSALLKYAAPFMWSLIMLSTLMLLTVFDAETFLISFELLALSAIGAILTLPNRGALAFPKSPFLISLLAFWVIAFVSVVFSQIHSTAFIFFCFLGMLPLSFIFVSLVPDKDVFFSAIIKVAACVYALLSLWCLYQYFFVPELLPYGLTQYPFGNPNSLAGYISLAFFGAYSGLLKADNGAKKALCFALVALYLAAIFTTGSRGGVLALIGGMVVLITLLRQPVKKNIALHGGFLAAGAAIFASLTFFAPAINRYTPGEVARDSIAGNLPLLWDRPHIWASAWDIIQDHFWTGIGVGTFFQIYPAYRGGDVGTAGHMVHNDILQFWAEMGVFAPLAFCAALGFALYKTVKVLKALPPEDSRRIGIVAPFCALGALVVHTQISFHFYVLPTLFITGSVLAYWFYQVEKVLPSEGWSISKGSFAENILVKGCLSALVLCCAFMLFMFQTSEVMVDRAKVKAFSGDMESFVRGINRADELSFGRNARALALASTVPARIVRANGANMPSQEVLKLLLQAESLIDRALANNPYLASAYHEKALIVEDALRYVPQQYRAHHSGAVPDVRDLMEKAFQYNPQHPGTRIKLSEVMAADGDAQEAYNLLKGGLKWKYLGTKGMGLYEKIASEAQARGDIETRDAALARIRAVYEQSEKVQARDKILNKKLGYVLRWMQ